MLGTWQGRPVVARLGRRFVAGAEPVDGEAHVLSAAPNPFNPFTTLSFTLPAEAWVRLKVYDVAGRRLDVLVDERRSAGEHTATWQGTDRRDGRCQVAPTWSGCGPAR